jgi:undecaprenyl-diphosphatase
MSWDENLFRAINGLAGWSSAMDWVMVELAKPGNLLYPGLLVAGYWLWRNWRECLIGSAVLAAMISGTDAIGTQLKNFVQRPRPCLSLQNVHELLGCGSAFSFPSNHAVNTAAAAAFFQVLYPRSGWVSWALVAVIGFSRVYIGAHYVTDVAGGWVLGGAVGGAVAWMIRRRLRWHQAKEPLPRSA